MASTAKFNSYLQDQYGSSISPARAKQSMGFELIKADPIIDAASVDMIKDYYRINHDEDDEQIRRNLRTALTQIENYTNRTIITRQLTARWKRYNNIIHLPAPPHVSVTSVTAIADDDTTTTLTLNTDYYEFGNEELWFEFLGWRDEELQVVYQAGYGKGLDDIPTWAQDAVVYQMGILYSNFDESMGTRVYDPETGLDQRAKVSLDGNRYLSGY